MDFSKMRHKIIFLRPDGSRRNSMGESVPIWILIKPSVTETDGGGQVSLTEDENANLILTDENGGEYSFAEAVRHYSVWGCVEPMTGREYQEAQKIRAETTYNITTRYFSGITTDMKILYRGRIFNIESVLNIGERNTELKIVASEVDRNGKGY